MAALTFSETFDGEVIKLDKPLSFRFIFVTYLLLTLALCTTVAAQPDEAEIQINTDTTGSQGASDVTTLDDGRFIAVWSSQPDGGSRVPIARFLDSTGAASGAEFQLESPFTNDRRGPQAVAQPGGAFVVVWNDYDFDELRARRYDSSGAAVGDELAIQDTSGSPSLLRVASRATGDFVVLWRDDPVAGARELRLRRFDSNGTALAASQAVAEDGIPMLDSHPDGRFVIGWCPSSADNQVHGQRFDSSGAPVGFEMVAGDDCTGPSDLAYADNGRILFTWTNFQPVSNLDIAGRLFFSTGAPFGGQFQINSAIDADTQQSPKATATDDGFVVAWDSNGSETDLQAPGIRMQFLTVDGAFMSSEIQANTYTMSTQSGPRVASSQGQTVVTWSSNGSFGDDQDSFSVQARTRFDSIFSDGFESGDVTRWRVSIP